MNKRRRKNNQKKIIIVVSLCLLFIMTVGYSAFQTNLSITAKGNVKINTAAYTLIQKAVNSGDGLYKDIYEENKYIFRGANPDNYIIFNNETWRILSVEQDKSIKIIRNDSIGSMQWDAVGTRTRTSSTYCRENSYGCNAWASTANLVGTISTFSLYYPRSNPSLDSTIYSGTVIADSSLNTYLNNTYYNTLNDNDKKLVEIHSWNVGSPGNYTDDEDIGTDILQEELYKWNGKIALINVTEVLRTTTSTTCTSLKDGYNNKVSGKCNKDNWLWTNEIQWTLSPCVDPGTGNVWNIHSSGYIEYYDSALISHYIRPSLYLSSDIKLNGNGTIDNPYQIIQ